jgi:CRISPR system Cascade subunit CasB
MPDDQTPSDPLDEFIANLKTLAGRSGDGDEVDRRQEDRAALARLRRCAGRRLADCVEVYDLFYRLLPPSLVGRDDVEERCFLVATLFALMPFPGGADVGSALAAVAEAEPRAADGVERRLHVLLDCSAEELPFRLRQTVLWLAPKMQEIGREVWLDWRRLLRDLEEWTHPSRKVQKDWARQYFSKTREASDAAPSPAGA